MNPSRRLALTVGLDGGVDGDASLGCEGGLGLGSATKKEKPGAVRASNFVAAVGFSASGCLVDVAVVACASFFASGRSPWGYCDSQLEDGGGTDHGGDSGLSSALPKIKPKASRRFALAGAASSSAATGVSFCRTISALSQPSRVACRHNTSELLCNTKAVDKS